MSTASPSPCRRASPNPCRRASPSPCRHAASPACLRAAYPISELNIAASSPLRYESIQRGEGALKKEGVVSPFQRAKEALTPNIPSPIQRVAVALTPTTVNPVVHLATAMLAALAGCVNAIGLGMFATTIGNVTGLVTAIAVDVVDRTTEVAVGLRLLSFFMGSLLSGVLISSRKVGMGTELYGIVLMLVSALIFAGWATASDATAPSGLAPCVLALAMGLQNGMLTKHAHAVVRTTHMTGITTDIGVIIGHQLGRWLHEIALRRRMIEPDSPEKRLAAKKALAKEWTQLKLLSLLLIAFFIGSIGGLAMFRAAGADALLLPACVEATMGVGYFAYRVWLRPRWKRLVVAARRQSSTRAPASAPAVPENVA